MASRKKKTAAPANGPAVVFCDIGNILGVPRFSPPPPTLEVFSFVEGALTELRDKGVRLGVISNTGDETAETMDEILKKSGILDYFEPNLLIYSSVVGKTKDSPEIFELAAEAAGLADHPERCLFVGEDPRERSFAAQAGFGVARDLSLFELFLNPLRAVFQPNLENLQACVADARFSALDGDPGPEDPDDFHELLGRLEASRLKLPPLYRETVFEPYVKTLKDLGQARFSQILFDDPPRERLGGLMMDIAHAILQNGEQFQQAATDAFEEVVSDLYDGFLSAQDRKGIKAPDHAVIAPLVKWGQPDFGPYTWPIDATNEAFDVEAAIVNLPPANARLGLMAWAALGHETAGHDILHADEGLGPELSSIVQQELESQNIGFGLAEYWSSRIDETASDVMGILNMGPAAGIGIVAYFRGLNAAFSGNPRLRSVGPSNDSHPADILRGYLAASTVRLLSFDGAAVWANIIEQETDRDVGAIRLGGVLVSQQVARQSAEIVAGVIASQKCDALNGHALIEIQDWRNRDEGIIEQLREALTTTVPLAVELASGVFAAHVVSAAVTAALAGGANIPVLFGRMLAVLKIMHDKNPSWGPLFILHPSTISRHRVYTFRRDE
ncbi:MAG: HAD family hydrolase [Acidobacteriota bacterium]|nr:HAD family hydrolase [Acidobacteriota bacterium]